MASLGRHVTVGAFGRNGVFLSGHPSNFASQGLGVCAEGSSGSLGHQTGLLLRDLNANQGALQRNQRTVVVDIVAAFAETLLGAFLRPRCAFEVDLLRAFGGFRQTREPDREALRQIPRPRQAMSSVLPFR